MKTLPIFTFLVLVLVLGLHHPTQTLSNPTSQLSLLIKVKSFLDPNGQVLKSWKPDATSYCDGSFEGVACDEMGRVVNISLQGKGLVGRIPSEIGQLSSLTGLYLHFNLLHDEIPKEIAELTQLTDLYLNVNNLSGQIPPEIGNMDNLKVLQVCYNKLSGSLPTKIGCLKKLNVVAVRHNDLSGAIPASLGNLETLQRLDLSFNRLFGSIPLKLADAPLLQVLDIRNNTLSGNVPLVLKKLDDGFQYANNPGLCGSGFADLKACTAPENPNKPEPFGPQSKGSIPQSADVTSKNSKSTSHGIAAVLGATVTVLTIIAVISTFVWNRRRKQRIGSAFDSSDGRLSTDQHQQANRKPASPLMSLEYSTGWDPSQTGTGFNVDDVESATRYFSESNLLGKSSHSATYRGVLRDGSVVAIKRIAKTSCRSEESEFVKGLKLLVSLKHENLVRLRGFCCSKDRGECFLIYDYVANGNLSKHLDLLDWSTRFSIIKGVVKGIEYLHGKPALVHQNISVEKVLLDHHHTPLLSGASLHKVVADDVVFSTVKASAAMGYLAPEYTTTGRFTDKSDVYAFGMMVLQIVSGKTRIGPSVRRGAESGTFQEFVDPNLDGKFSERQAAVLGNIALLCTHECPDSRPTIGAVAQELMSISLEFGT